MADWLYVAISIPFGFLYAYLAYKLFIHELFEVDDFNEFIDFFVGCLFLTAAFAAGFTWPVTMPIFGAVGMLYYVYWLRKRVHEKKSGD